MTNEGFDKTKTNPGMHRSFLIDRFSPIEQEILQRLKSWWYLTHSGRTITLSANSTISYFIMRPVTSFAQMFNLDREIICVFSPYTNFESRTLDAFPEAEKDFSSLRIEKICRIVVSADPELENKVDNLLKSDPEQPIVIPFTYNELENSDEYLIRNRFRKYFYSRDLFAFLTPLKTDLYFFGRSEAIQEIINRHRSGEHSSLFGLRKSGKTSIIFAIERFLKVNGDTYISIDCESPSIHHLTWNELLRKLVVLYKEAISSKYKIPEESLYTEKNAADQFFKDMKHIYNSKKSTSILVIFDEIERISPGTASSNHWRESNDFVYFWQTLRAFYQRNPEVFTYMLVGTNPSCIESSYLNGHENPIFKSIPSTYIPPFNIIQVREMVRKLGRYMGMKFQEPIYSMLYDDFGGHPFLIRQMCSEIHKMCQGDRPITVDKPLYLKAKATFSPKTVEYLDMMVQILKDCYHDEYDVLVMLATGDIEGFKTFAQNHPQYTNHLIGYGLIEHSDHGYAFCIELAKNYLINAHNFERLNLSWDEKIQEISSRRNKLEKAMRFCIKNVLKLAKGKKASETAFLAIPSPRRTAIQSQDINDLFSPIKSPLYFLDLINIIRKNWDLFENLFEMQKDKTLIMLEEINEIGRPDAHAKQIDEDDFLQIRLHFTKLEKILSDWT